MNDDATATTASATPAPKGRALYGREVGVFLFLIVPSLALSFLAGNVGAAGGGQPFTLTAISVIFRDLALTALVLFFVWRNREGIRALGLTLRGAGREALVGVVLFPFASWATGWLERTLQSLGFSVPSAPLPSFLEARDPAQMVLATVLVVVVAFSEETLFRGYLLLRFQALTRSPAWAVVLSSVIFSLGHGYEGGAGMISVGVLGAIFAVVYLWRGSLVAPMVMHFLQDFVGIVVMPLLGKG